MGRELDILKRVSKNMPGALYEFYYDPKKDQFGFNYVSSNVENLFGIKKSEFLGSFNEIKKYFQPEALEPFFNSIEMSLKQMSLWTWEGEMINTQKGSVWMRATSMPERLRTGTIVWAGVMMNCTEQKNAKDKIAHQEKLIRDSKKFSALGELAGSLAHEINTPLSTLGLYFDNINQLLLQRSIEDPEILKTVSRAHETIQRLNSLVTSVLSFARSDLNEEFSTVDLEKVVNDAIAMCHERAIYSGIVIEKKLPKKPVLALCRPVQALQILINLINNAIDATSPLPEKWIRIEIGHRKRQSYIRLVDSGPGIDKEITQKMMSPFFTTKPYGKGTGLGLSIALDLAQSNRGDLHYMEHNLNTSFLLTLPKAA